jgi:hypothetical protein
MGPLGVRGQPLQESAFLALPHIPHGRGRLPPGRRRLRPPPQLRVHVSEILERQPLAIPVTQLPADRDVLLEAAHPRASSKRRDLRYLDDLRATREAALAATRRAGDREAEGRALNNLGIVYLELPPAAWAVRRASSSSLDRRDNQRGLAVIVHRPAGYLPRRAIYYGREEQPALPGRDISNVPDHFLAGPTATRLMKHHGVTPARRRLRPRPARADHAGRGGAVCKAPADWPRASGAC